MSVQGYHAVVMFWSCCAVPIVFRYRLKRIDIIQHCSLEISQGILFYPVRDIRPQFQCGRSVISYDNYAPVCDKRKVVSRIFLYRVARVSGEGAEPEKLLIIGLGFISN